MKDTTAQKILCAIEKAKFQRINLMEVCGTHTMAVAQSGMRSMFPKNLRLLSGPGCPVCVTPQETIDYAIALAKQKDVIITTFGDMIRVPGTESSLEPFSPKIVYSALDALMIAKENPTKKVIFIGVGFETTSPTIAATLLAANTMKVQNFYLLTAFKLIPPALEYIAQAPKINIHGFILPGHVSTIIGSGPYQFLAQKYRMPGCITGFEPIDILKGILNLVQQITRGEARIDIEYKRVVKPEGNKKAVQILNKVFEPTDARWRGIGVIKNSGLQLKNKYKKYDVRSKFDIRVPKSIEPRGCICGKVLLGLNTPDECGLFGNKCTPLSSVGPCMVSSEGACAAYYKYGDYKRRVKKAEKD
ncbi:MAG: hydrogenase formation protein HypD [candidate division WOR-3 bacterium]|nr:MAG: hydrogenase formation protein HypD [candidate division WOR-3 bacterium]